MAEQQIEDLSQLVGETITTSNLGIQKKISDSTTNAVSIAPVTEALER